VQEFLIRSAPVVTGLRKTQRARRILLWIILAGTILTATRRLRAIAAILKGS
jgi:hypothetical protein